MYLLEHENPNAPIRSNGKRGWYYPSRRGGLEAIQGIVVHSPEAGEDFFGEDTTAEDVAKFFARVKRPASTHAVVDSDSIIDLLPDIFVAFHAAGVNTKTLSAEVGWDWDSWKKNPAKTESLIRLFAAWVAPKCISYDIPLVRVIHKNDWDNGARGFLEHSLTEGWRGKPGRRKDPGPDFPWDFFFESVQIEMNGVNKGKKEMSIKMGDEGNTVAKIQKGINGWISKFHPDVQPLTIDKEFGPKTRDAVKSYQKSADLPATGEVEGVMMAMLMEFVPDWIDAHTNPSAGIKSGSVVSVTGIIKEV